MCRVEGDTVGERCKTVDRSVLESGQLIGTVDAEQIGTSRRTDEEAASGEQGDGLVVDEHEVTHVFRRVPRRVDRTDHERATIEILVVERRSVAECDTRGRRQNEFGADR